MMQYRRSATKKIFENNIPFSFWHFVGFEKSIIIKRKFFSKLTVKKMAMTSIFTAIGIVMCYILSLIAIPLPFFGGNIEIYFVPIFVLVEIAGFFPAFLCALILGIVILPFQRAGFIFSPVQILLDYNFVFLFPLLSIFFRNKFLKVGIPFIFIFFSHSLSGNIFFSQGLQVNVFEAFGISGVSNLVASLLLNIPFNLINATLTLGILFPLLRICNNSKFNVYS